MTIKVIGVPSSPQTLIIIATLNELGVPFELISKTCEDTKNKEFLTEKNPL